MLDSLPPYSLRVPPQIVFGWGRRSEAGRLAQSLGRRAFLLAGSRHLAQSGENARLAHRLAQAGLATRSIATSPGEPQIADVDRVVAQVREYDPGPGDLVVALGGGSTIDLAKAVAALAVCSDSASVAEYLEGVGTGRQLDGDPLPVLALPTTAGTGSEATKNAVITQYDPPLKKSLRSDRMVPAVVLVDPELTVTNSPQVTAHSGMDAITQLIESYLTRGANRLCRALALHALPAALEGLPRAVEQPDHRPAREALAQAALISGICLANTGLGLAHGVAAALGCVGRVPHGLACAVMLPAALRFNLPACVAELAQLEATASGRSAAAAHERALAFISRIEALGAAVGIPRRLSELGICPEQLPALVAQAQGNSLRGNPVEVANDDLARLLERML